MMFLALFLDSNRSAISYCLLLGCGNRISVATRHHGSLKTCGEKVFWPIFLS
jgi:hypothetical protein